MDNISMPGMQADELGLDRSRPGGSSGLFWQVNGRRYPKRGTFGEISWIEMNLLYTWNPNDLYFWRSTPPKTRAFPTKARVIWVPGRNESFIETKLFVEMMQLKVKPQAILQWPVSKKQVTSNPGMKIYSLWSTWAMEILFGNFRFFFVQNYEIRPLFLLTAGRSGEKRNYNTDEVFFLWPKKSGGIYIGLFLGA